MFRFLGVSFATLASLFRSRKSLLLENLALRQQLSVLKRRHPRPRLGLFDKLFWVVARRVWSAWKQSLILVTPETVVRWHRTGFRMYWRLISRVPGQVGRKRTSKEVRELIFRMVVDNPTWGAPRIHGELLMLGFDVSERTISRWMKRGPRDPERAKRWLVFLRNHREAIAAMDFFTVPTITFGLLYGFFVISHDRRRILHFNVTKHPSTQWIIQQLREAFPFAASHKYLIFDRDQKFGIEVMAAVKAAGIIPEQISFRSPWQNGLAERWVGGCRRDLLDHIIAINERHLKRVLGEYVSYHQKTARILAFRSKHRLAGLPLRLPVGSCLTYDLEGCTIATIVPPNGFNAVPRKQGGSISSFIYMGCCRRNLALRGGFFAQVSRCDPNVRNVHQGNNGIKVFLARIRFWRGTGKGFEKVLR